MSVKVEKGLLKIDIAEMFDGMTMEDKRKLADSLSIYDDIIEDVVSQVIDGWTELGSHGAEDCEKAEPYYPLGKAIRRIALGADAVAAKQVDALVQSLKWQEAHRKRTEEWAWQMYHSMNNAHSNGSACPLPPAWPEARDTNQEEYIVVRKCDCKPADRAEGGAE